MKRGLSAESSRASRSLRTALYSPCSKSTKVSEGQIFCLSSSRVTNLPDCSSSNCRTWSGCRCSLILTPQRLSSPAWKSTSNSAKRTRCLSLIHFTPQDGTFRRQEFTTVWGQWPLGTLLYNHSVTTTKKQEQNRCRLWTTPAIEGTLYASRREEDIMKRQLSSRVHIILGSLLILGPWSAHNAQAAVECSQASVQSVAPANPSIVSAMPQSDPVAFCDVLGYVTTTNPGPNQVNFELGLPMQRNGRFLFIGNGFFAGSLEFPAVFFDSINPFPFTTQVSAGFATAITDTGHQADVGDASWALNDPGKQDDWLYRGVHVSAVEAKAIVRAVYGLSDHPKPANEYHLKTGQRERRLGH